MKVAVITCYKDPDYIRARVLRAALADCENVQTIVIKNKQGGVLKYFEVMGKILAVRFRDKPDVYFATFRAYELLPFLLLVRGSKKLIFDEYVNPLEAVAEHQKQKRGFVKLLMSLWLILGQFYYWLVKRCDVILTDTNAHADYSAKLGDVERSRYHAVVVGADEALFKPLTVESPATFQVFYYGSMLPLHGLEYVFEAAMELKAQKEVQLLVAGGGEQTKQMAKKAQAAGAQIVYKSWITFEKLPEIIRGSALCLAGPFGNGLQAGLVITGKTYQFLACAAPVVVGRNPATEAYFKDKENSLVIPRADSQALAQAILWAFEHQDKLHMIGKRGRLLYENEFSVEAISRQLSALLSELAS